jgi:hypothetical protein
MIARTWKWPMAMLLTSASGCLFIVPPPVFGAVPDQQAVVGRRLAVDLADFASDPEDRPLTFSVTEGPGAIEGDTVFAYTPTPADVGEHAVEVAATNGLKDDRSRFTVVVVDAP